jgi:anaerobic selenocysteine-containing dehydrogenase
MRSEVDIIAAFAERILPAERFNWSELRSHRALREAMAEAVPGYRAASAIDRGGGEFRVEGRTFHSPRFATSDGRARFHVTATSGFEPPEGAMRMMTLRSEGQFNTVVYDQEDLYRGNRRRDVLMVSAADARALGLGEGDGVVVENEVGSLELAAAIVDIRPGNLAMYYPEANALVPRRLDPRSRTPAFKSVAVRVRPVTAR